MKGDQLKIAKNAIAKIAEKDGVSVEYVKDQIMFAMMSSFSSEDPEIKNFWDQVPHEGAFQQQKNYFIYFKIHHAGKRSINRHFFEHVFFCSSSILSVRS